MIAILIAACVLVDLDPVTSLFRYDLASVVIDLDINRIVFWAEARNRHSRDLI